MSGNVPSKAKDLIFTHSKLFSKYSIFMSVFECFSVDDGKNASKDIGVEEA